MQIASSRIWTQVTVSISYDVTITERSPPPLAAIWLVDKSSLFFVRIFIALKPSNLIIENNFSALHMTQDLAEYRKADQVHRLWIVFLHNLVLFLYLLWVNIRYYWNQLYWFVSAYIWHPLTSLHKSLTLFGGARGVIATVVGNGHGEPCSNPGRGGLHFLEKVLIQLFSSSYG